MYYRWLSVLSALSAVPLADLATSPASLWGDTRVKHTWDSVPANWESLGRPAAGTTIDLHVALKPHRENALIDALYEVSSPENQKYGEHLSKEQVAELVAPHQDTLDLVYSWLGHRGIPPSSISTSHGGGWLTVTGVPVSQADELLCASYQLYRHTGMNGTGAILRTVSYALPAALHAHVQTVVPTTNFASPGMPQQTPRIRPSEEAAVMVNATLEEPVRTLSGRDDDITPPFLRTLYKTQTYVPTAMGQNKLGVLGFKNDFPIQPDLTTFMTTYRPEAISATFTVELVNNGLYDAGYPGSETSMDMQYAQAMAYPTPHVFYSTGGGTLRDLVTRKPAHGDGYLGWLEYLLSQPKDILPPTVTISWGFPELFHPVEYTSALCTLFGQLGLRGVSILVATGDSGVGHGDCKFSGHVVFNPMFPASCPWVTSVGGTTSYNPEVAASFSGGGFSLHFARPNYQDTSVIPFLQNFGSHHAGLYNPVGRGIPDISAQSSRFLYFRGGESRRMTGTSCSTPTVAGVISLFNDYLITTGRHPLGFLNPWLYSDRGRGGFNDITSGNNPGCNTDGFYAVPGWDPVTGLGTPNFLELQRLNPP